MLSLPIVTPSMSPIYTPKKLELNAALNSLITQLSLHSGTFLLSASC